MEKVLHEIRILETDKGIRIEVEGKGAKEWAETFASGFPGFGMACCCVPEPKKKGK